MTSAVLSLPQRAARVYASVALGIDYLQPFFALALRLYVARVFFLSGLTKIHHWQITLALFRNEYHVPLLPPAIAAVLGTSAELGLPILLFCGFGTRADAVALLAFNIVAAISYPDLSTAGLKDHILWGALLLVLFFYGPGRFSLDHWFSRRLAAKAEG
jgi:putative oxidoreductase